MLDDMIDYAANIRDRPVWRRYRMTFARDFTPGFRVEPSDLGEVYREFTDFIVPYATGNVHPGFMGWVHGGGTAVGMLAEMLAAGLNANLGGRDHIPIEVERQIVEWTRAMFGFPGGASGIFVTGTSMANLMAVLVARTAALGPSVRQRGVGDEGAPLTAYTSTAAHGCIAKAMDLAGLRQRCIAMHRGRPSPPHRRRGVARTDRAGSRGRPEAVSRRRLGRHGGYRRDRRSRALSALCREEELWFHVDGAYGALGILSPALAPRLAGMENANSIALDFHKWGQVPYDAGFLIVRDGRAAPRDVFRAGGVSAPRNQGACRRLALALRSRARSVARLPRAQDLVHPEDLRHRKARSDDRAHLRARRISGSANPGRAAAGIAGAGAAQYRLLPLSRRRRQHGEWRYRRRYSGIGNCGAVDDGARRPARDTGGDRQSPHRHLRYRCADLGGAGIRRAASGCGDGAVLDVEQSPPLAMSGACASQAVATRSAWSERHRLRSARGFVVIQQLLLVGDEFLGFLQRLIEIAAQDVVVDAFDDRPRARRGGDDIAHQIEIGAVIDLGSGEMYINCTAR